MRLVLCETGQRASSGYRYDIYFVSYDTDSNRDVPLEFRGRPVLTELWHFDSWKRYINDEIHNWLVSYEIDYSLFMDHNPSKSIREWGIDIPDDNKAMLFKLTWCGK